MKSTIASAILSLLILPDYTVATSLSYSCPSYEELAQPSVNPTSFAIEEFGGLWNMIATNEPTLPSFCTCSTNDVTVSVSTGKYSYINSNKCLGNPMTISIAGLLSDDPNKPGDLRENLDNPITQLSLKPNMVFHVIRDEQTHKVDVLFTYACISSSMYSFNVLSLRNNFTTSEIQDLINEADTLTNHVMKVTGMRVAN